MNNVVSFSVVQISFNEVFALLDRSCLTDIVIIAFSVPVNALCHFEKDLQSQSLNLCKNSSFQPMVWLVQTRHNI